MEERLAKSTTSIKMDGKGSHGTIHKQTQANTGYLQMVRITNKQQQQQQPNSKNTQSMACGPKVLENAPIASQTHIYIRYVTFSRRQLK